MYRKVNFVYDPLAPYSRYVNYLPKNRGFNHGSAGCRYLQFDDSSWGELCDTDKRAAYEKRAGGFAPLRVSPQCGFSSTKEGNILAAEDQWKKVALLKEIAEDV